MAILRIAILYGGPYEIIGYDTAAILYDMVILINGNIYYDTANTI